MDERERLSYWVEAVCDTYVQLDCDATEPDRGFHGQIEVDQLATLGISRVTAASQRVRRTPAKIARTSEDLLLISIQATGAGIISQDGRTALLEPGDFTLYDSTRPYELAFGSDFQQYVLTLPGSVLRSRMCDTEQLTARKMCGTLGAGHLMIGMIKSLAANIHELEANAVAAVVESVENIIVAGLSALPGAARPQRFDLVALQRDRIKDYIAKRLRNPHLSVREIASHLRMSPSTVHRAFEGEPMTVNAWIRARRLESVRRDLCNPALANRSISEIAFSWGFNDAAHFSRAFRAHFGCSARELRSVTGPP